MPKAPRMAHRWVGALVVMVLVTGTVREGAAPPPPAQPPPPAPDGITYTPPRRGAPGGRVSAGTRTIFTGLHVLAPKDHTGLTTHNQPILYWHLSQSTAEPVECEVVLLQGTLQHTTTPVLQKRLAPLHHAGEHTAGLHRIRFADLGLSLQPKKTYQWSVTVVRHAEPRSRNPMAGGTIALVTPPPALVARLNQATPQTRPQIYAAAGIWYDAVAALSTLIEEEPQQTRFRHHRALLLEGQDLSMVAAADKLPR